MRARKAQSATLTHGVPGLSRREFFRVTAVAGAGLAIGIWLPGCGAPTPIPTPAPTPAPEASPTIPAPPSVVPAPTRLPAPTRTPTPAPAPGTTLEPNIYVTLDKTGKVTITAFRSEMGQGVRTAIAMILAEELDADWGQVTVQQADADRRYGDQVTGGSVSISRHYSVLRQAGAAVRQLLLATAAQRWGVEAGLCRTEKGAVISPDGSQRLPYGELVEAAGKRLESEQPTGQLKDAATFNIIGTPQILYDAPAIAGGHAIYGLDVQVPGMLYATVARCPVFEGKATRFDATQAKAVPGVVDVIQIDRGIAVVAESTYAAIRGRAALAVTWDEGRLATWSSDTIREVVRKLAPQPAQGGDASMLEVQYEIPYLAHATMEPMNCTADVRPDRCEVWAPSQDPQTAKRTAQAITGLPPEAVTVHVTMVGGGFGRRHQPDFVEEAVQISKAVGAPVKVVWTREDDIQHDFYHPFSITVVSAKLDANGVPAFMPRPRIYPMTVGVPTGAWRSVENFTEAFARESFLDEVAAQGGMDPLDVRRKLLKGTGLAVVEAAAAKAGWGTPLPAGSGRGLAYYATFDVTHVAQVAEVTVSTDGQVRVKRVVCAVNCGQVINPDTVTAQMEGGIVFGLTAALKASITIANGRVEQSNFADYPLLPFTEMPAVEVIILPGEGRAPTGIGEMGVPPIAPAVANAIFAATGKRVRYIPIRAEDLKAT